MSIIDCNAGDKKSFYGSAKESYDVINKQNKDRKEWKKNYVIFLQKITIK